MKKGFLDKLDQRYLKICAYASATVIITVVLLYLLSNTGGFWTTLWTLFTAILKPVIIGGIICYLFLPIVNKIESKLAPDNKTRNRRIAVAVFYGGVALVLGGLVLVLYLALRGGLEGLENAHRHRVVGAHHRLRQIALPREQLTGDGTPLVNLEIPLEALPFLLEGEPG